MAESQIPCSAVQLRDASVNSALSSSSREREVFRFLEPWRRQSSHLFRPVSFKPGIERPPAVGCDDTALSAFAQLGAFRLKAQRCMIVLFGRGHEYVLAESTQTLSLQSDAVHSVADGLWIGTASFASDEGLSECLLPTWMSDPVPRSQLGLDHYHTAGLTPSCFIVNDMREHEAYRQVLPAFNSRIRFLAAVPLRSHRGLLVGAYIVLDDIPRYGVSETELSFLEDMSRTVLNHLSAIKASAQKKNAERLIKGLSVFTQGGRSLRDWWYEEYDAEQRRSRKQDQRSSIGDADRERRANEDLGDKLVEPSLDESCILPTPTDSIDRTGPFPSPTPPPDSQVHDFAAQSSTTLDHELAHSPEGNDARPDNFDLRAATSLVFSRASNLIREAMNADGVLFLEAGFTQRRNRTASVHRRNSRRDDTQECTSTSDPSGPSTEETSNASSGGDTGVLPPAHKRPKRHHSSKRRHMRCEPLGYCTRAKSSINAQDVPISYKAFSQRHMEKLLDRYPAGKVFNFAEDGSFETSSSHEETDETEEHNQLSDTRGRSDAPDVRAIGLSTATSILRICTGARSVVFLPLWDAHREKWRAGAFVWTTTPGKYLTRDEDLAYLLAFADSIAGSMTRLDMIASDQAKFTFISTISHELRSPLHGVLAGSEYLLSTRLTNTQHEMAMTVKIAAGSLLETINGILDFTKIDASFKLDQAGKGPQASKEAIMHHKELEGLRNIEVIDVAELTENVVNTVLAGHHHMVASRPNAPEDADRQAVQVILDIAYRPTWTLPMSSEAWTRILTNLTGNSLKYTKDGYIHVRLDSNEDHITLVIQDTGPEISEEYQKHHLYTAFQQEDPLVSGTGLGLYIVKQLVTDLGGRIIVESSTRSNDKGTKILITVPVILGEDDQVDTSRPKLVKPRGQTPPQITLLTRSPIWNNSLRDNVRSIRSDMLKSSIRRMCRDWLHASFQNIESIEEAEPADLCLMLESEFAEWWEKIGAHLSQKQESFPHLTILAERYGHTLVQLPIDEIADHCTFLDPPFGPRKLARVLEQVLLGPSDLAVSPLLTHASRRRPRDSRDWTSMIDRRNGTSGTNGVFNGKEQQHHKSDENYDNDVNDDYDNDDNDDGEEVNDIDVGITGCNGKKQDKSNKIDNNNKNIRDKRVLLVEDNDLNMRLLVAWSRRLGASYVEAVNGLEALQAYTADPLSFDLVVMDISMPIMDGFTATSEMRAHEHRRKLRPCRIVALTGVASDDARASAVKAGVDDFIVKPASLAKLKDLFHTGC